ncbi:thermonuclease family protein [Sphingomonas sp.]|uniref:thermonuclease family protein n=1 Tax=Sphingomonas sp. TaxID=28214 RepID=UPI002ED846B8
MKYPFELHQRGRPSRTWHRARPKPRLLARRPAWLPGRASLVTMTLAGMFGGLGWAAWPMLSRAPAVKHGAALEAPARDPWAESRRSAALLEPQEAAPLSRVDAPPAPPLRARFTLCHSGGGSNCVVDGDTFWMNGTKIRIADIDTPETHPARCPREAELGAAATRRLHALLNAGAVSLASAGRDADRYGRKLRLVSVDGQGVGDTLVSEGLARRYAGGYREGWCG